MLIYCGLFDGIVNFWEWDINMKNGGVLKGYKFVVFCFFVVGNLLFSGFVDFGICVWRRLECGDGRGGDVGGGGGEYVCIVVLKGYVGLVKCMVVERD